MDQGNGKTAAGFFQRKAGGEVVEAIEGQVAAGQGSDQVGGVRLLLQRQDLHGTVNLLDPARGSFRLAGAKPAFQGEELPVQVACGKGVAVNDHEAADPHPGQQLDGQAAEAAGADHADLGAQQPHLAVDAHGANVALVALRNDPLLQGGQLHRAAGALKALRQGDGLSQVQAHIFLPRRINSFLCELPDRIL